MRKILLMWIFAMFLLSVNFCSANYYDDNSDYIYIDTTGSGGYRTYLYRPSVHGEKYNDPYYYIEGKLLSVGGKKQISESWQKIILLFDMRNNVTLESDYHGGWNKENISGTFGSYYRKRADAMFRVIFGKNFYGY